MFTMPTLAEYKIMFGDSIETEKIYYQTYLLHTDYVVIKMMEAQLAGTTLTEDYSAIMQKRVEARQQLDILGS